MHRLNEIIRSLILIGKGRSNWGFCPICEHGALFIKRSEWLRDDYVCLCCNSIPRQRALIRVLETQFPDWRQLAIHESSPAGATSKKLQRECGNYEPTHYWPDLAPGSYRRGHRCENLERMTFEDQRFDLVVTQDVFEHVMTPARAFKEIGRTLKPFGAHVFTVPYYRNTRTVVRAVQTTEGVKFFREPIYHSNPIDEKGSLVATDWGDDLLDFIYRASGMATEIYALSDPRMGLEAEFLEVFVSRKDG